MTTPQGEDAESPAQSTSWLRRIVAAFVGLSVSVLFLELGCLAVVEAGVISARVPNYEMTAVGGAFWGDYHPGFGAWHPPHASYRHQKACFDVTYESNAYGARDIERAEEAAARRVVVLGDSFMEGYGVGLNARLSNVLEASTGVPHLNFGTSGNAGSTHAFALYRELASRFRHDAVLCAILPDNDFDDDLPASGRYLPYWHGDGPEYELRFPVSSAEDSSYRSRTSKPGGFDLEHALREFTYTKNVVDFVYSAYKQRRARNKARASDADSRFFRYSPAELLRLKHSYRELAALAAPQPVVLFTIPRLSDFAAAAAADDGLTPLDKELSEWSAGIDNVHFVPLLPELSRRFVDDPSALFLSCDPHWSDVGHRAAAEILRAAVGEQLHGTTEKR